MKAYTRCVTKTLFAWTALSLAFGVHAASFDCAKASSSLEKMICENPSISEQDSTLSRLYGWVIEEASLASKPKITSAQKNWITQIRDICTTTTCLASAYGARIEELATIKFDGGTATYLGDAADIARITKQIEKDLRQVGITQPLGTCSHILSLDSHPQSYGAFCSLGSQNSVEVCNEDIFGNLAVNFSFERTGRGLAAFTQAACPGG